MILRVGDTPQNEAHIQGRFDLHLNEEFVNFLSQENMSITFTTYEGGKLIIVGPGHTSTVVAERNFERCMALHIEDNDIYISTFHNILQLENAVQPGQHWQNQWDKVYVPRSAYFTGGVDMHEIFRAGDGHLYGVVTGHNCVARINHAEQGGFTPYWKPPFITEIIGEDRCHLNGMCLEDNQLAYATMVGKSNENLKWKEMREDGGLIMDMRSDEVMASGICMPHTPRIWNGDLWFLEAGRGYFCKLDLKTGEYERVLWRPGFLRGLHFYKNYAFICVSAPRDQTFAGLPLDKELADRNAEPICAVEVIDMDKMEVAYSISITGAVKEIYDVGLLSGTRQPLLHGFLGEDIRKIVVYGQDETSLGPLADRKKKLN